MEKDHNSYISILKSISILGGVKIVQILISIIKNKFIAMFLGPTGIGISGMLTSTTNLISSITGLGLHTSAINDFSHSYLNNERENAGKLIKVIFLLTFFTGIVGTAFTFVFSSYISNIVFGNNSYTLEFRIISAIILLDQMSVGKYVIIQGSLNYKYIGKLTISNNIISLIISIPLIFYFRLNAIAPIILITSLSNWLFTYCYAKKINIKSVKIDQAYFFLKSKKMIMLGFVIALSGIIHTTQTFIFRLYIAKYGNISDVGLYTAGSAIITSYVGIILTSMGADYSPRLASAAANNDLFNNLINKQIAIVTTIITPIILLFIIFIKEITLLLYSTQFLQIVDMLKWMSIGMIFRGFSWCLSFAQVAKSEPKFYFINELISNLYLLFFSIFFYSFFGVTGIGIAFLLTYILYSIQTLLFCRFRFKFSLSFKVLKIFFILLTLCVSFALIIQLINIIYLKYIIGIIGFILVSKISLYHILDLINKKNISFLNLLKDAFK